MELIKFSISEDNSASRCNLHRFNVLTWYPCFESRRDRRTRTREIALSSRWIWEEGRDRKENWLVITYGSMMIQISRNYFFWNSYILRLLYLYFSNLTFVIYFFFITFPIFQSNFKFLQNFISINWFIWFPIEK